jgi:hypothetical protein
MAEKLVRVGYCDFWSERKGNSVVFEDIQSCEPWNERKNELDRDIMIDITEGVGECHVKNIQRLLPLRQVKLDVPRNADLIVCSQFGTRRIGFSKSKRPVTCLVLCYEAFCTIPDTRMGLSGNHNAILYLTSDFKKAQQFHKTGNLKDKHRVYYYPIFCMYWGLSNSLFRGAPQSNKVPFAEKKNCISIISNVNCPIRNRVVQELTNLLDKVDNFGKLCKNVTPETNEDAELVGKTCWYDPRLQDVFCKYKFVICMENSSLEGYHTEKIMHAYRNGCIPIYWGDPNITSVFNPRSMLRIQTEADIPELLQRVQELCNDEKKWTDMIRTNHLNDEVGTYFQTFNLKDLLEQYT